MNHCLRAAGRSMGVAILLRHNTQNKGSKDKNDHPSLLRS